MNNNNNPIGMIDSGLGGLSLLSIFGRPFRMKTLSISLTRNIVKLLYYSYKIRKNSK